MVIDAVILFKGAEVSGVIEPETVVGHLVEDLDHPIPRDDGPKHVVPSDQFVECFLETNHVVTMAGDLLTGMR